MPFATGIIVIRMK